MSMLSKVWDYYRQQGLRSLLWRIHRRRRFVILTTDLADVSEPPTYDDVEFRLAGLEDISALSDLLSESWGARRQEDIRRRLVAGDMAIVGFMRNTRQMGCVTWLSRDDRLFHTHLGSMPPDTDVCSRKLYVPERFRRRGLMPRGATHVVSTLFLRCLTTCDRR